MSAPFDARTLTDRYSFIDDCPSDLLPQLVTLPLGTLAERVAGVRAWRESLLKGAIPQKPWPPGRVGNMLVSSLEELGIARYCKDQSEIVDALLSDLIAAVTRQQDEFESQIVARLDELAELEREHRRKLMQLEQQWSSRKRIDTELDRSTMDRLRRQAREELEERSGEADAELVAKWAEHVRLWSDIAAVFGDLGHLLGRGWDLSLGVLRQTGWLDVLRLRELIEQLPQIQEIVRSLGRLQASEEGPTVVEPILAPMRRVEQERRQARVPGLPAETRGIERGGSVSRMLPAEAMMLGHPALRMLWHARRAERALLIYRVEGLEAELVDRELMETQEVSSERPRPERGPVIAVVDTSGSMHGMPEKIAKAFVLQVLRMALEEQRRCLVFAYSGPGQVLEHELELSNEGLGHLMAFLGMSFEGGSDEAIVLQHVLERLEAEAWTRADVAFVSDGEWPVPTAALLGIQRARDNGTRFTGVQIGNKGQTGLHGFCDPVHEFREWAALAGWG